MTEPLAHVTWKPLRGFWPGSIAQANEAELRKPQRWNNAGGCRVLVQQDLFAYLPDDVRSQVFRVIDACQNIRWLVVTNDPSRVRSLWPGVCHDQDMGGDGVTMTAYRPNVALLVRCRDQLDVDVKLPRLIELRDCATVSGVFLDEPFGQIDLRRWLCCPWCATEQPKVDKAGTTFHVRNGMPFPCPVESRGSSVRNIDWIVLRGGRRPMHPDLVRSIRDQCQAAAVPFWFDTWGWLRPSLPQIAGEPSPVAKGRWGTLDRYWAWRPHTTPWNGCQDSDSEYGEVVMVQTGREQAGRTIDGQEWTQLPRGFQ